MRHAKPTGRHRYRFGWRKALVLQIEMEGIHVYNVGGMTDAEYTTYWRDATIEDLGTMNCAGVPTPRILA